MPASRQPGLAVLPRPTPDAAAPVYAVLLGLDEHNATLRVGTQQQAVRLVSLARLWRGDFATFWQPPAHYQPDLRDGSSGAAVDLLASHLARIEGSAAPSAPALLDADMRNRIRAFQRTQGLDSDGRPGPLTFMQLERAASLAKP